VAGLLGAALDDFPRAFALALGFNAAAAVAGVRVPGRGGGFAELLARLDAQPDRGALLNPVVGAEAVAGSSRMKGGSATWILCAAMVEVGARAALAGAPPAAPPAAAVRGALAAFEAAVRAFYALASPALARALASAAAALSAPRAAPWPRGGAPHLTPSARGRLFYIGRGAAGLLGLVDASEATDTYGAAFNDVRAFCAGGWPRMAVAPGAADPAVPRELRGGAGAADAEERACPALEGFAEFAPTLCAADAVVALWVQGGCDAGGGDAGADAAAILAAMAAAAAAGARVHAVAVREQHGAAAGAAADLLAAAAAAGGAAVDIALPALAVPPGAALPAAAAAEPRGAGAGARAAAPPPVPALGLLALKLALNALTTGAFVARGVVVGNVMANMMLTNHKLFLRALRIVDALAGCGAAGAHRAVLRAVYGADDAAAVDALVAAEAADAEAVLAHVARAATTPAVIPTAALLAAAGPGLTVAAARQALAAQPRVALALRALREKQL
jgi:hypothetical protein